MKKLSVCLFAALATAVHAGPLSAVLMGPTTNQVAYNGTTWQISTIAAATTPSTPITNQFNLNISSVAGTGYSIVNSNAVISTSSLQSGGFIIQGGQVNTNQLPVYAIDTFPGAPGTIYGPMNQISIFAQVWLQAAASVTRTFQLNWYQSNDGVNVLNSTNALPAFTQFVTVPSGQFYGNCISNFTTGASSYLLMGQMINSNEVTGTNWLIEPAGKAGM